MKKLDIALWLAGAGLLGIFVYLIINYIKGLKDSPREIFILFIAKVVEYAAYGAMNLSFVLYLSADCGLSDISAGSYIGVWSMGLTLITIFVGAVCDALGIKKTLMVGTFALLFARLFMPFLNSIVPVTILGFIPVAFGVAIMGPVLSVGIKRFTTKEGTALGFALFYTLMNVGWAIGGYIFDKVRTTFGEHVMIPLPLIERSVSTYQFIFFITFFLTILNIAIILLMRDGVRMGDNNEVIVEPPKKLSERTGFAAAAQSVKNAAVDTVRIFSKVVSEKGFWVYIFMLGILVFVRIVFYHFHYTFPKYGIRLLGEGVKVGNIYSVLNPTMIVFLVPLVGVLTRKVSSYRMMIIGTCVSASSVFIATIPAHFFSPLMNTWVAEIVFDKWLNVPAHLQNPIFFALILFIMCFTVGESIWSPRLMQFTAEIAPKGKEGSYISLSYLPFFASKLIAGPLSGWLVATYTPAGATEYPYHFMVWVWIGGMAVLSPLGLIAFRKLFHNAEREQGLAS